MRLVRGNAWTEIRDAPSWFCDALAIHLSVPCTLEGFKLGVRFGGGFQHGSQYYGSLVHRGRVVAAGLTPHVQMLAQHYRLAYTLHDLRERPMGGYPWFSMPAIAWRPYQERVHHALIEHGYGVIDAMPRCLSGDTWIGVHRNSKSYRIRLRDLVERVLGPCPRKAEALARVQAGETMVAVSRDTGYSVRQLRHWKAHGAVRVAAHQNEAPTLVRYRDPEGYVRLAPLLDAVRTGVKPLVRVVLASGRSVRASRDHKFYTAEGWKAAHDLREGSLVWEQAPRERTRSKRGKNYPYAHGLRAHPHAHNKRHAGDGYRVAWHRLAVEAEINGLTLAAYVARVREGLIDGLRFVDPREFHVHHVDHDMQNYSLSNLMIVPRAEHLAEHGREHGWRNVLHKTRLTPVVRIEDAGEGDTYDLCMPEPHNFLANGIVVSNSGKTAMAARVLDVLAMPCVYTAPSLPIVRQTYERFCQWFGEGMVARLDGEATPREADISKPIVIATAASAARQSREWWRTRHVLVIDEFHHAAAETYHQINDLADHIFHRYAFTGTHFRTGEDGLAMEAVCSQVLARVGLEELVGGGYLARPRVIYLRTKSPSLPGILSFDTAYRQGIVDNEARNAQIVDVVGALRMRGVPTIVLTRRRKHADELGERIAESVVVKGGEQALTSKAVQDFAKGRFDVLVGTTVIGEGVDLPRAAALVYASGGNGGVGMMQSYFRPLTALEGKPIGRIYDFWDDSCRTLGEKSKDRLEYARTYLGAENVVLSS